MQAIRRLDLIWTAEQAAEFDAIKRQAEAAAKEMPLFVKEVLRRLLNPDRNAND